MNIKTIYDLYSSIAELYKERDFISYKRKNKWIRLSPKEAIDKINKIAMAFDYLGFRKGDKISLISETRYEWTLIDFAMQIMGIVNVPIYPTLNPEQTKSIIKHSDSKAAIFSNENKMNSILEYKDELHIEKFILIDNKKDLPDNVIDLEELEELGIENINLKGSGYINNIGSTIEEEDLASIIYTSGTTGAPKGVMLSHKNFISNCYGALERINLDICKRSLLFLPLSHAYARTTTYTLMMKGITLWYSEKIETLARDMLDSKPNVITVVPRLLESIYEKVLNSGRKKGFLTKKIFYWALRLAEKYTEKKQQGKRIPLIMKLNLKLADKLVYEKIRDKVGGNIKYIISGSSALSEEIAYFFNGIGLPIIEGYGLTEASPMVSGNSMKKNKIGTIGYPYYNVKVKLSDDNEILVKGSNVMQGYYKNDEETKESFTKDGWLKTGDVGEMDQDNYIRIIDRKKNFIKTSNGKIISPQKIENKAKKYSYISEFVVVGDQKKFPSAIILPNFDKIDEIGNKLHINYKNKSIEELIRDVRINKFYKDIVNTINIGLEQFEKIKKFILITNPFSIDNGEITPTMKVIRKAVTKKYEHEISLLYASS
jgi:long-chain acyl-CoA synthetase